MNIGDVDATKDFLERMSQTQERKFMVAEGQARWRAWFHYWREQRGIMQPDERYAENLRVMCDA